MPGLTYDAGALLAAERGDRRIWAIHLRALQRGARPVVPAGVLGQAWRGGPQAELSRLLKGCVIEPLDDARARSAGTACGRAATSDVTDAAVVVGALARADHVVTSDPGDIRAIASALDAKLNLLVV